MTPLPVLFETFNDVADREIVYVGHHSGIQAGTNILVLFVFNTTHHPFAGGNLIVPLVVEALADHLGTRRFSASGVDWPDVVKRHVIFCFYVFGEIDIESTARFAGDVCQVPCIPAVSDKDVVSNTWRVSWCHWLSRRSRSWWWCRRSRSWWWCRRSRSWWWCRRDVDGTTFGEHGLTCGDDFCSVCVFLVEWTSAVTDGQVVFAAASALRSLRALSFWFWSAGSFVSLCLLPVKLSSFFCTHFLAVHICDHIMACVFVPT